MKTPFPAYYFDASGNPFNSVRVRPCSVLNVNEASGAALISVGSLAPPVEKWVTIHSLASDKKKALEKFGELLPSMTAQPAAPESAVKTMAGGAAANSNSH